MLIPSNKLHIRYFHYLYSSKALRETKGKVLDVGCGRGEVMLEIKKENEGLKVVGCDADKSSLAHLRQLAGEEKVELVECDANNLPFEDESFEAVLMLDVLEHLKNPNKALLEIKRVLKDKGIFHLVVPCEADLATIDGWVKKLTGKNLRKKPIEHIQQFTFKEVINMLKHSGFKVESTFFSYHIFYQFFSFIYYFFLAIFNKSKYLQITNSDQKKDKFLYTILKSVIIIGLALSFIESSLLKKIRGQTVHITSLKV